MNRVYLKIDSTEPLNGNDIKEKALELIRAEGAVPHELLLNIDPNDYARYRLSGTQCACNGDGEFVLEPLEECLFKNGGGGKYYMKCRKCGEYSHL